MSSDEEIRLQIENLDLRRLLEQAGIDAAELKVAAQLQRVLLEELHHRVKNTLATVMAITSQSLRQADSLEHAREAITGRLLALGRVHDLLLQVNWSSAPILDLVKSAIVPFDQQGDRFQIEASAFEVSPSTILPLSMVLNELCTNALKYGALSGAVGRVAISALADAQRKQFRLRWGESGGPAVTPPKRSGFGSQLIQGIAKQLQGEASVAYEPAGVAYVITIPLRSLSSAP